LPEAAQNRVAITNRRRARSEITRKRTDGPPASVHC